MKIKICGITSIDDARTTVDQGADALGFVFVQSSPRYVAADRVAAIVATIPASVLPVGVFVDEPRESIERHIRETGIRAVQLHGDETPEETAGFDVPVIKGHRMLPGFDPASLLAYTVHVHLLDAWVDGIKGGTGKQCDWNLAAHAAGIFPIVLSGGLNPENVGAAIHRVKPEGVDVSSGVELRPGVKDHKKVRAFIQAAQQAFISLSDRSIQ
jgi:phosphoribosylanthranilate isomerase